MPTREEMIDFLIKYDCEKIFKQQWNPQHEETFREHYSELKDENILELYESVYKFCSKQKQTDTLREKRQRETIPFEDVPKHLYTMNSQNIEKLIPGINVNKDKYLKPLPKEFIPDENNLEDMKKYKKILDEKNKNKKISKAEYESIIWEVVEQVIKLEDELEKRKK